MNKILIILLSTIALSIIGCAGNNYVKNGITGIINARGHEPFVYLSLETAKGEIFEIESPDSLQKILWEMQGLKVTLEIKKLKKNLDRDVVVAIGHKFSTPDKKKWEK